MYKGKTIFIAPLDWGLGHATRCVPFIKHLMVDNVIILGVTPLTSLVLTEEFPTLTKVSIEPYNINYSKILPITLTLLFDARRIKRVIKREHEQLINIIKDYAIDVVISDNRFGLYAKGVESVYITHQLNIQAGWLSGIANKIHHSYIKCFTKILVPDYEDSKNSLAGKLSQHPTVKNVTYIGPLSRLSNQSGSDEVVDYLLLLSGPEPMRTALEQELISLVKTSTKQCVLVRGSNKPLYIKTPNHLKIINIASSQQLSQLMQSAKTVVCRSGYSTLMDLHELKKKHIILVPTPGQHEQVYLANYWQKKTYAKVILQKDLKRFNLE